MVIEIGCGEEPINENTPHLVNTKIDLRVDAACCAYVNTRALSTQLPFVDNSVDGFVSQHLIEHHTHSDVTYALFEGESAKAPEGTNVSLLEHLREIKRALKVGGFYETICPNLAFIAEQYVTKGSTDPRYALQLIQWAMGGQRNAWDYHYILLDFNILSYWATMAGFGSIQLVHPFNWFGLHTIMVK
jgi:predicted SAM-dependent methyltransferase